MLHVSNAALNLQILCWGNNSSRIAAPPLQEVNLMGESLRSLFLSKALSSSTADSGASCVYTAGSTHPRPGTRMLQCAGNTSPPLSVHTLLSSSISLGQQHRRPVTASCCRLMLSFRFSLLDTSAQWDRCVIIL